jgi:formate dehydrogenase major subunit
LTDNKAGNKNRNLEILKGVSRKLAFLLNYSRAPGNSLDPTTSKTYRSPHPKTQPIRIVQTLPSSRRYDSDMRDGSDHSSVWPLWKQIQNDDFTGLGQNARSPRSESLEPRTVQADKVVSSICPYCAVGCGQLVYVKDEKIVDIEGDPRSPISNGCLCPKGAATFQLVTGSHRVHHVLYRRPFGTAWEEMPLERAMNMVAERVRRARETTWEYTDGKGNQTRRTMSMAHLGGATLDNEENYLIKKLFTALGIVQIDNQARI